MLNVSVDDMNLVYRVYTICPGTYAAPYTALLVGRLVGLRDVAVTQ